MTDYDRFSAALRYESDTGRFFWRIFISNNRPGSSAGSINSNGYVLIGFGRKNHRANRVAWLLMTGDWPTHDVDHRNGVRSDNCWLNLRAATDSQNQANRKRQRNNTTGFKGVSFHKGEQRFHSRILIEGRTIFLGSFMSAERAHAAYVAKATEHFGEYARAS